MVFQPYTALYGDYKESEWRDELIEEYALDDKLFEEIRDVWDLEEILKNMSPLELFRGEISGFYIIKNNKVSIPKEVQKKVIDARKEEILSLLKNFKKVGREEAKRLLDEVLKELKSN